MRSTLCAGVLGLLARTAWAQPDPAPEPPPAEPPVTPPATTTPPTPPAPATPPAKSPPPSDPSPVPSTVIAPAPAPAPDPDGGFRFGSYGRVLAGSDLRGGKPEPATVVAHGPRIVEESYVELDFSYSVKTPRGHRIRPVITLAFDGTLFHETGNFDAQPALRNLFLEAQVSKQLTAWVGSRMYRGDDIYLFDYWPLDDQNTVGAGLWYTQGVLELGVHAGLNRLEEPSEFQFQQIEVLDTEQGARTIVQLNRQRFVASATGSYRTDNGLDKPNFKLKLHGETHALPSGERELASDRSIEPLPADTGFLVGAQLGTYGYADPKLGFRRFANIFVRYARGLAAFDELSPPTSFGSDLKAKNASELTFGISANWDHALGNIVIGGLSRRFVDADRNDVDVDDGWEYAIAARPLARIGGDLFAGGELSYQARFPRGISSGSLRAEDPAVFQVAPMLVYSPMGPSGYDRPQIRLVYRAARLNEGARELFAFEDPRRDYVWTHFLGVQAEWWFNSASLRR